MSTYVTSKAVIGRVFADLGVQNTGWEADGYRWIRDGLQEVGATEPRSMVTIGKDVTITSNKGALPCRADNVLAVVYEKSFLTHYNNRVPLTELQNIRQDINSVFPDEYYTLRGNYINTSFQDGTVTVYYESLPLDEDGRELIPNVIELLEALTFRILYKLMLKGYKHPVLSIADAKAQWSELSGKAANILVLPTPQESITILTKVTSVLGVRIDENYTQ